MLVYRPVKSIPIFYAKYAVLENAASMHVIFQPAPFKGHLLRRPLCIVCQRDLESVAENGPRFRFEKSDFVLSGATRESFRWKFFAWGQEKISNPFRTEGEISPLKVFYVLCQVANLLY